MRSGTAIASVLALAAAEGGCSLEPAPVTDAVREPAQAGLAQPRWRELRASEQALRAELQPLQQPPWLDVSGADPYRVVAWPARSGFVGVLRGARALVSLSGELEELSRVTLPESPTSLCLHSNGEALVASRYAPGIQRVKLAPNGSASLVGALSPGAESSRAPDGIADLACAPSGLVYVLPASGGELSTLSSQGKPLARFPALPGGLRLLLRGRYLLESSLFERALRVLELDAKGLPSRELARIRHDGPIWAFDALARGGELLVAVAGAEDEPLVRAHGEFENIDSFVWLYRVSRAGQLEQLSVLNVSEHGVVVPKAIGVALVGDQVVLSALAAGSGARLTARYAPALGALAHIETWPALPGASDAVFASDGSGSAVYASPLLDAWISLGRAGSRLARVDPQTRPELQVRLGEALFFSELMAPDNPGSGTHSRFSCETCHFEGGVDGRIHYTGRGDVSVVTKPLFGLANNRPHFSRALDPDLSAVAHHEFRVAGAGSGRDPWFTLATGRFPWLRELGVDRALLTPLELRQALLAFLYQFTHAPNPHARGRSHFTALESAGAGVFARACVSCHAARSFSDRPESAVPFERWQELVLSRHAPIVWARGDYARTGVEPYVHELGTRIPSLRRLHLKPRYFTNGSALELAEVVARFRDRPSGPLHHSADGQGTALAEDEQLALLAFLQLL